MRTLNLKSCASVLAISAAVAFAAPASAQTAAKPAPAAPAAEEDTVLDTIVVTASTGGRTALNTSTSINSISGAEIQQFNATSTAELYRLIPGIQVAGTQGDGGNSNIGIRGLRTPTGGSPFVQVQEDGLPTVLFGDIQFGNNDYWTRYDPQTERIEAIRGGTASTLASQAIGAVLNHISFTGKNDGGYVEVQKGVNYDYTKLNARISGSLNDTTYFNLGGSYNIGRGIQHAGYNVHNSYLIKGNLTKEFADGNGFVRLLFKVSDTQEPSYNGCISNATLSGTTVSGIGPSALCDARSQAPGYSTLNQNYYQVNNGVASLANASGISTKQKYLQLQAHYDVNDNFSVDENARVARMSGTFNVQFYGAGLASGARSATQSLIYANGPNAGKVFTGQYVSASAAVSTNMEHMDHVANDLSVTYKTDTGGMKVNLKAGWFYYSQRIAENWHSNNSINEASGNSPAQLDLVSGLNGTGNLLSIGGQTGFNAGWNQKFDATFTASSPYADLNLDIGDLNLNASGRYETFRGTGTAQGSTGNAVGNVTIVQNDPRTNTPVSTTLGYAGYDGPIENINFSENAFNWSLGALYKVTPSLSLFARASRGTRFNADRLTRSTPSYFNGNGTLSAAGLANSQFPVQQYELGLKNRGNLGGGRYSVELTAFYSKYTISSQEINPVVCSALTGVAGTTTCIVAGNYKDYGLELFTTYKNNGFNFVLSATYDNSKRQANPKALFLRSENIPSLTYSGLISYDFAKKAALGLSFNGQSSTPGGDGNTYPGSTVFGAFLKVRPIEKLELGLDVYNLFNTFALQGAAGFVGGSGNTLINAQPTTGRALRASVRLNF
jgi:outer membrane receptor protein involved in Fe transport